MRQSNPDKPESMRANEPEGGRLSDEECAHIRAEIARSIAQRHAGVPTLDALAALERLGADEQVQIECAIREGLEDLEAGRSVDLDEVIAELLTRHSRGT